MNKKYNQGRALFCIVALILMSAITFTGSRYVMLDRRTPRASVDFELFYASPRSDNPR
jgi:hypothetical protein